MGPDVAHKLERFVCHRCNWWRIVALIEPNGDSPPSRRRMFALPLSGRNSKWSDPFFFPSPSPPSSVSSSDLPPHWRDSGCWRTSGSADSALPSCRHIGVGCQGVRGLAAARTLDEEEGSMERGMMKKWEVQTDRLQKRACHFFFPFFFALSWGRGCENSNWNAKKGGGGGGEVIDNRDEAICAAAGAAVVHQNTRAVN